MRQLVLKFWKDDRGSLLVTEWVFLATILVIGIVPGIVAVRNSLNHALSESAKLAAHGLGDGDDRDREGRDHEGGDRDGRRRRDRDHDGRHYRGRDNDDCPIVQVPAKSVATINQNPCD